MKTRFLLLVLFVFWGCSVGISQNYSGYGQLIGSGTYTCTGIGFQGMETKIFSQPLLMTLEIYENAVIFDGTVYNYVGTAEYYFIKGRKYVNQTTGEGLCFLVDGNGAPHLLSITTQNYPFVGNVTTTSLIMGNIGDTRSAYVGGGFNGGVNPSYGGTNNGDTYNTQPRQRNCNHCHGTGLCPNCNGSGWVVSPHVKGQFSCVNCNRNGEKVINPNRGKCPLCGGVGKR